MRTCGRGRLDGRATDGRRRELLGVHASLPDRVRHGDAGCAEWRLLRVDCRVRVWSCRRERRRDATCGHRRRDEPEGGAQPERADGHQLLTCRHRQRDFRERERHLWPARVGDGPQAAGRVRDWDAQWRGIAGNESPAPDRLAPLDDLRRGGAHVRLHPVILHGDGRSRTDARRQAL